MRYCKTKDLVQYLRKCYGEDTLRVFRKYENFQKKTTKCQLDIDFLRKCKIYNVVPKFIRFKLYKKALTSSCFYKRWLNKLLVNELNCKQRELKSANSHTDELNYQLLRSVSFLDYKFLLNSTSKSLKIFKTKILQTHSKKLANLGVVGDVTPVDPDKVIHNFSSVVLSTRQRFLLAFGLDFSLPVYSIDFYRYFLNFEKIFKTLEVQTCENLNDFKFQLKCVAHKYYYGFKPYKIFSAIFNSKEDLNVMKSLRNNKDLVISKPDKGNSVVLVNRSDYVDSMNSLVNNSQFEDITDSIGKITLKIEDKINNFLRKLKTLKIIDLETYQNLFVKGSGPGILYGLPKIHKIDFSTKFQYRPIFAAYNCASYKISKFIIPYLAPFTKNQFNLSNSYDFSNKVKNLKFPFRPVMVSFDIENLFTSIPLEETIEICLDLLFNNNTSASGFTRDLFEALLRNSILNSIFTFNQRFYLQKDGLGMGLPLSPILADIFLSHHEQQWLSECPTSFKPIFYNRYVDDTFILFRQESHVQQFLEYLNSKHPNINFTFEKETGNILNFLDCKIVNNGGSFDVTVYRKQTFSGMGMSFFSFCPLIYKLNNIKTLISRVYKICSNHALFQREFEFLLGYFCRNGYPRNLVRSTMTKFLERFKSSTLLVQTAAKNKFYFSIPYFGPQSDQLRREILTLLSKFYPQFDFNVSLANNRKISSFFPFKDRIPIGMQSGIVYNFRCAQCASEYIGSTLRTLNMRHSEHAGRSFRTGKLLSSQSTSAIRTHSLKLFHSFDLTDFTVLARNSNELDIRILESLFIHNKKPKLNNMQSSYPLQILF